MGFAYLDASAIVKLVVAEPETAALERDLSARPGLVTSRLGAAELLRAAGRSSTRRVLQQVEDVLESFVLIEVTAAILDRAARLQPWTLRTLDAIHLSTAAGLDLAGLEFITYDARLADAAAHHGLRVKQPGAR
jgi:predicted nucleic acid-binding protein